MLYWTIVLSWGIIGTIIFWSILSKKWKKINPIYTRMFDSLRAINPIPGDPGYLDIKFTLVRHAASFLVSSFIIYFVKPKWILTIILMMNVLYAVSVVSRYKYRKRYIQEESMNPESAALISIISIPVKDSFCSVVYSVLCSVLLYVLYALRP